MQNTLVADNRFMAPIAEKTESELLQAIRRGQADAHICRNELRARGWGQDYIDAYVRGGSAGLAAYIDKKHAARQFSQEATCNCSNPYCQA